MRITNNTILRGYNRNLKNLAEAKYTSEKRIYTGRQYWRASESPLQAAKALTIRKQLYDAAQYKENLKVADKFYTEAETTLLQVSDELASIRETLIYGCNSTKDVSVDLNILAQQLVTKASEMCELFNTDSAERVIFGGESNNAQPFSFRYDDNGNPIEVLYHGVPVNALANAKDFPYSNDVFVDIGIGMNMNQLTQYVDPQSMLKISFNGAQVTGCGYEQTSKLLSYIDLNALKSSGTNEMLFTYNGVTKMVQFEGNSITNITDAIKSAFTVNKISMDELDDGSTIDVTINGETRTVQLDNGTSADDIRTAIANTFNDIGIDADDIVIGEDGSVSVADGVDGIEISVSGSNTFADVPSGISINGSGAISAEEPNTLYMSNEMYIKLDMLTANKEYSIDLYINGERNTIKFKAGADAETTMNNFNAACNKVFEYSGYTVSIDDVSTGIVSVKNKAGEDVPFYMGPSYNGMSPAYSVEQGYSKNYIQLTLDAARALRQGDLAYANACIDRIVSSSENLLVEIADLGNSEDFIQFNTDRLDRREENLLERQKDVEGCDEKYEITLWKTYEAIYNACLQMSSSIVPNSIFSYIR